MINPFREWANFRSRGHKASSTGPLLSIANVGRPVWSPRDYAHFAKEGLVENVIVYRAVTEVTRSAASVPWQLFRRVRGDRQEQSEHPLLGLLGRPNPMQARFEFIEAALGFFLIAGNSFIEAVAVRETPDELWPLRPDRMKVIPSSTGLPMAFQYEVGGRKRTWPADPQTGDSPVLHLKTFHPLDDWYGLSPVEPAARNIDQRNAADAHNLALLQNGARPSGALVFAGKDSPAALSDDQFARLKVELREQYSGERNAGRPLLLEGGLDWREMSLSPKDMDFLEGKHSSSRDIALAFGVPPQLLGIPGDNTYSNYQEARLALWEETVIPLLRHLRDELNGWLAPKFGEDLELDLDLDEIPALAPRRAEKWEATLKAVDRGVISRNEAREALGFGERGGADELLVPATLLPLGFELPAGESAEEALSAGLEEVKTAFGGDLSYKLLTDRRGGTRQREQAIQLRLQVAFQRALTVRAEREIRRAAKAASEAFQGAGVVGVDQALQDHPDALERLLSGHYQQVMEAFGNRLLEAGKGTGRISETKDTQSDFRRRVLDWIARVAAFKVRGITETTRRQIADVIAEGEAEGIGVQAIARRIVERTGGTIARVRAGLIARTETHAAAVAGGDQAARALDIPELQREWIAAEDARTRESHRAADGQIRGMEERFDVGSEKLLYPGDPDGPPEETVRCRCVLGYVTPDE